MVGEPRLDRVQDRALEAAVFFPESATSLASFLSPPGRGRGYVPTRGRRCCRISRQSSGTPRPSHDPFSAGGGCGCDAICRPHRSRRPEPPGCAPARTQGATATFAVPVDALSEESVQGTVSV